MKAKIDKQQVTINKLEAKVENLSQRLVESPAQPQPTLQAQAAAVGTSGGPGRNVRF